MLKTIFPSTPIQLTLDLVIGGRRIDSQSDKTLDTINPATREVLAKISVSDGADADLAIIAARKVLDKGSWPRLRLAERMNHILRFATLIEVNAEEIVLMELLEVGEPITHVY